MLLRFALVLIKEYPREVALVFGTSVLATVLEVAAIFTAVPLLQAFAEQKIIANKLLEEVFRTTGLDRLSILQVGALICFLLFAKIAARLYAAYLAGSIATTIEFKKKKEVLNLYTGAEWAHLAQLDTGKTINVTTAETGHLGGAVHYLSNFLIAATYCAVLLVSLLVFYIEIAPLLIFVFGMSQLIGNLINRRTVKLAFRRLDVSNRMTGLMVELTHGIKLIKTLPDRSVVLREIINTARLHRRLMKLQYTLKAAASQLVEVIGVMVIGALFIGALVYDFVSVGDIFLILVLLQRMVGQASAMQTWARQTVSVLPSYDVISRFMADLESHAESTVAQPHAGARQTMEMVDLRNVHYAYPDSRSPTVSDISFSVSKGEMVAIVGPSGSGKTTVIDLLTRLIPPQEGDLLINGHSAGAGGLGIWREGLSYVPQSAILFAGTIRDNITRFGTRNDSWPVDKAIHVAVADEFVSQSPDGLDTEVKDRGANLSGGQSQRLAIARGLHRAPALLILDEATSALDQATEHLFWKRLRENIGDMTVIFITHRLANIQHADKVVVMRDGQIEAVGPPPEILDRSATFTRMKRTTVE